MAKTAKKKKTIGVVLPDWLNVRVEPDGRIIEPLAKGTAVEIVAEKEGWANIHVDTLSGWVMLKYLAVGQGAE